MIRTMKLHLWRSLSATAALAGTIAMPAHALADSWSVARACDAPQLSARIVEVRFSDGDAPIDIPLHPEILTTVRIDSRTVGASSAHLQGVIVSTTERGLTLGVGHTAAQNLAAHGLITAETAAGPVPFALRTVAEPERAIALALVRHRTPADAGKPAVTVVGSVCSLEREMDSIKSTLTDRLRDKEIERARAVRDAEAKTFMTHVDDRTFSVSDLSDQGCSGDEIVLCPRLYTRSDSRAVLLVDASNRTSRTVPIQHARVVNKYSGRDHALLFGITDDHQRPTTLIEPGERVKVAVLLRDPDRIGGSLRLVLSGASSVLPAAETVFIPSPIEQAEQEFERRKRLREAQRVQIHAMGSYGALFVASGAEGATDATGLMGLGARVVMGITPMWAFEAEIAGGSAGETSVQDSAQLGRVVLGGRIRRGESTVWHARLGLGLQALRTSTAAGTETAGSGIIAFGAGIDWRLGDQLTAGVSAGTSLRMDVIQTLEAGIHIGWVLMP